MQNGEYRDTLHDWSSSSSLLLLSSACLSAKTIALWNSSANSATVFPSDKSMTSFGTMLIANRGALVPCTLASSSELNIRISDSFGLPVSTLAGVRPHRRFVSFEETYILPAHPNHTATRLLQAKTDWNLLAKLCVGCARYRHQRRLFCHVSHYCSIHALDHFTYSDHWERYPEHSLQKSCGWLLRFPPSFVVETRKSLNPFEIFLKIARQVNWS